MQNLPIIATPPAAPAQASASMDNNAAQAAEPFDSVLARQHANASESNTGKRDSSQPASSPADSADATAFRNKKLAELQVQVPAPDGVSTLPGDMLAALLPTPPNANGSTADEKPALQKGASDNEKASLPVTTAPDGIGILPGDMLATLAPTSKVSQGTGTASATWPQPVAADIQGGKKELMKNQVAPSLFRSQDNTMPVAAAGIAHTNSPQGNAFSIVLETSGKDTASTTRLNIGTAQISVPSMQPDATVLSSALAHIGTAPIATGQDGPAQAVINTPVTHDAWGDEFNQKVTWLATQHEQSAELHLNPPHLGPMDVVIKVSGDQATAMFTSPHAAVRDAVEQALPKLREMMADNGITLGNATVSDQSPKEQPNGNSSLFGRAGSIATANGIQVSGTVDFVRRHQGMVDTFV